MPKCKKIRWKGKYISEEAYKQKVNKSERCKNIQKRLKEAEASSKLESEEQQEQQDESRRPSYMEGRRIVEFSVLGDKLWCVSCKEALSLQYIEEEIHRGLGSILFVRCHKCLLMNTVTTGKQHFRSADRRFSRFDVNTKAVLGVLHGGLGHTHLNKVLSCLNVPTIDFKTFKRYEQEVGQATERVAKESCQNAADLERQLTVQNIQNIEQLLPQSLQSGFLIPNRELARENVPPEVNATHEEVTNGQESLSNEDECQIEEKSVTFDDVVRIMVSYDMGWSRRGTGRNYDSLNGFGAIIGSMSGLVLDYSTRNRKCKKCDSGNNPANHDCRLNFWGTAKAMEPDVAKDIVTSSTVLQSKNLEVGVLIGDDDSSTIAACRAASSHTIVKHSDINHASGGVKKALYKIEKTHRELTKDGILYLHRCFTYALAQNKGNSAALSDAIRCIPYHAFNDHSKCGSWCGYIIDKENYDHRIIPGGFRNPQLFESLREIFEKLASNAQKFSAGASSNSNESLNAIMASKAPKSRCYSMSESADFRFACAIGQKNIGESYTQKVAMSLGLSPGKYHSKHISKIDQIVKRRRQLIRTQAFKKKRLALKKLRSALRHRIENREGVTYENNCALFSERAVEDEADREHSGTEGEEENDEMPPMILVDLETSGFGRECDILQIAAKCGSSTFETYVNPTQQISASATGANGLTNHFGELLYHGVQVASVPLRVALGNFHCWLTSFGKKCYIATHNLSFDGPRIYDAIKSCSLKSDFSEVVHGFIDTLGAIRKHTGRKGKGECTITGLAEWLSVSTAGTHNAINDVAILHKVLKKCKISKEILINHAKNFCEQTKKWDDDKLIKNTLPTLDGLKSVVGENLRKKMAKAAISIEMLKEVYRDSGAIGITKLLGQHVNGESVVTSHKKSITKIVDWLGKN